MVPANGSRFKLVYSHWLPGEETFPIANGLMPSAVSRLKSITYNNYAGRHLRIPELDDQFQSPGSDIVFRHSNFVWHFIKQFSTEDIIREEQVLNDDCTYIYPIEIEKSGFQILLYGKTAGDKPVNKYDLKSALTPNMLSMLRSGKVKLLFVNIVDSTHDVAGLQQIEVLLNKMGISGKNVIIAQGNAPSEINSEMSFVSGSLSLYQAAESMSKYPYTAWQLGYVNDNVKEQDLDISTVRGKKFLSFNRTLFREHRVALCYLALKFNLLKDGTFSFLVNPPEDVVESLKKFFPSEPDLEQYAEQISALLPYEIDTQCLATREEKESFQTVGTNNKDFYASSYLHLTTETSFSENETPFFSEKTWRPIMNLQPFIYIGNPTGLRLIKELGFKTFHPYINEEYDSIYNPAARMEAISLEIRKFADRSINEIHDWYYSITDILLHNQKHLSTFLDHKPYGDIFKL